MDVYHVTTRGKLRFVFKKEGNRKPTRVYSSGFEMRSGVAFYIFNRDVKVIEIGRAHV